MITVKGIPLQQKEISLLATYQFQYRNEAFVEVLNAVKDKTFKGSLTVKKGIEKFIVDNNLDREPLFIEKGIISSKMKDVILLKTLELNHVFYVQDYSVVFKMTDAKYRGEPAGLYEKFLMQYTRFNAETNVDFSIVQLHEMGFYNALPDFNIAFELNHHKGQIRYDSGVIDDERNPIFHEIKKIAFERIINALPRHIRLKGDELFFVEYHQDIINYFEEILVNNRHYSLKSKEVQLDDEIIIFESSELLEKVITNYIVEKLEKRIIPLHEIHNMIDLIITLPEIQISQYLNPQNIFTLIEHQVIQSPIAKRNYFFAKDILEKKSIYQTSITHLDSRQMNLSDALIEIFDLSTTTKRIYIASQYLLMNFFSDHPQAQSDRKNKVIRTLISLSKKFDFKLIFLSKTEYETDDFIVKKIDFSNIHGRYAIVINTVLRFIKLDAELDHFASLDEERVIFKDLSYLLLKSKSSIPLSIKKKVGELND